MIELVLINVKGERFSKFFDNPYLCNKFKQKLKYSTKLTLAGEFKHS